MKHIILLVIFAALSGVGSAQTFYADLVIKNAEIHTMDPAKPTATSLAVYGDMIIAIGTDGDTKPLTGPKTQVIDAAGRVIVPGFNDAHVHFMGVGSQLSSVDLRDAKTPEEFVRRIKDFAAKLPKGAWILGGNWDHENWTPNDLPTAAMIDAVTPDNPVFIDRLDGHMALANSLAMKLAKVTKETKDVAGGLIVRDAKGDPTGVFKDEAMGYINRVIPDMTMDQALEYAKAASDHAASLGVTSVQDMSAGMGIAAYQELLRRGELKTRIYGCSPLPAYENWKNTGVRAAFGGPWLRIGCLKGFADGSLGSTTAWFFEPYLDDPSTSGLAMDVAGMERDALAADKLGMQINIHAIGDRANAATLYIYEKLRRQNGARDRRSRIEHAQHLRMQDIPRFAKLGVIASMQPTHAIDDGRWAGKRLDEKRLKGTYAFRSLLDSGAVLAFGTDSPVASLNPLIGIYSAVTRRTTDGKNPDGWIPEQKITVEEAVRAYTYGSAYAEFQEKVKGTLAPGMLADMVILSDNIFKIDPVKIADVHVVRTIVGGKTVYEANGK